MKCAPPRILLGGEGSTGLKGKCYAVEQWNNECLNKFTTKIAKVCCDRQLLSHSSNYIHGVNLTFAFVSQKSFRRGCFVPLVCWFGGKMPPPVRYASGYDSLLIILLRIMWLTNSDQEATAFVWWKKLLGCILRIRYWRSCDVLLFCCICILLLYFLYFFFHSAFVVASKSIH